MIRSEKLQKAIDDINNISVFSIMRDMDVIKQDLDDKDIKQDTRPLDIILDSVIMISQQAQDGKIRKAKFIVVDKWLKPTNVFSVIGIDKPKTQKNVRILFYDTNAWYIRRGIQAASTVHVRLVSTPKSDNN